MNIAEGKGPKQTKKTWPLGKFVTNYGNDGTPGALNPPAVAYAAQFSNGTVGYMTASGNVAYAQPGSVNPGLNLNVNGNGAVDISIICAPDSSVSLQDIQSITALLNAESGWTGTATVRLQGTYDRYTPNAYYTSSASSYSSTNWSTLATATIAAASTPTLISIPVADGLFYTAYRLTASGGTGIIDWALPGLFADLSAVSIGQEATWVDGSIGQLNIADSDMLTISGGVVTNYNENPTPFSGVDNNHDYFG